MENHLPVLAQDGDSSDDEIWEQVSADQNLDSAMESGTPESKVGGPEGPVTFVLESGEIQNMLNKKKKRKGISKEERIIRIEEHKAHLLCLLSSAIHRNKELLCGYIPRKIFQKLLKQCKQGVKELNEWWHAQFRTKDEEKVIEMETDILSAELALTKLAMYFSHPLEKEEDRFIEKDFSVLLFVAACRACGLSTRLVASLHPIPLSFSRHKKQRVGESDVQIEFAKPIHFWAEVEVKEDWIPVDPVSGLFEDLSPIEPKQTAPLQSQYSYIIALNPVFGVRDVTSRYASHFIGHTTKLRLPLSEMAWWEGVLWLLSSSEDKEKNIVEDVQMHTKRINEGMPKTLSGFQNHPLFALERHLKQNQIIHPLGKEHAVGMYKNESVYPRTSVYNLQSAEAWLRQFGRVVKQNEEPMKRIKARATTIRKKREIHAENSAFEASQDLNPSSRPSMTELFAEWQTEEYKPEPIKDGFIPKNSFGNIELFHGNMLPPDKGIGKVAKKLGIDYAEAVVRFEFYSGRCAPVIEGIVVASENAEVVLEAYKEEQVIAVEKERKKREKRVLTRWKSMALKLMNKAVLFERYKIESEDDDSYS